MIDTATTWALPTDAPARAYNEMPADALMDAYYAADAVYNRLCQQREAYLTRVRDGVLLEDPLLRDTLQSVCELAGRELERVKGAQRERLKWKIKAGARP